MKSDKKSAKLFSIMTAGSLIGLVASFIQMMDKITLLKNSDAVLVCNINDSLSCSTVLDSWQASVLGPPNALISTVMFSILLAVSFTGLTKSILSKTARLTAQFLSLFTLGFGMWFLHQSIFIIESLCIYCIFNTLGLLMINATWLKLNYLDISSKPAFHKFVERNFDILAWITIALAIIAAAIIKFS